MRKTVKVAGLSVTALIAVVYLISCLTPYISPTHFSAGPLFSLAYIPVTIVYLTLVVTWSFINRKIALILSLLFCAGYKNHGASIGLNVNATNWKWEKDSSVLRVMCWNVNYLGDPYITSDTPGNVRRKMIDYISTVQPDILCLQDYSLVEEGTSKGIFYNNTNAVDSGGNFLSQYFAYFYMHNGSNYSVKSGVAIFSKFPLADSGTFITNGEIKDEKAGFIEIILHKKRLRVYGAHLSSMALWPNQTGEGGINYLEGDSTRSKTSTIISKLMHFGKVHAREAEMIKKEMNRSPYPFLLSADMNAVPSSYVYHTLQNGLQDAFLEKDFGIGGTYNRVFPKLRIDVLLHSKEIEVVQFTRPAVKLSDHYPLIADIRWKK